MMNQLCPHHQLALPGPSPAWASRRTHFRTLMPKALGRMTLEDGAPAHQPTVRTGSNISIRVIRSPGGLQPHLLQVASLLGRAFWEQEDPDKTSDLMAWLGPWMFGLQLALQLWWMHIANFDSTVSIIAVADEPNKQNTSSTTTTSSSSNSSSSSSSRSSHSSSSNSSSGTSISSNSSSSSVSHSSSSADSSRNSIEEKGNMELVPYKPVEALQKLLQRRWRVHAHRMQDTHSRVVGTAVLQLKVTGKELHESCGCEQGQPVIIVSNVAVDASARRAGVGRRMMQEVERTAVELYCTPKAAAAAPTVSGAGSTQHIHQSGSVQHSPQSAVVSIQGSACQQASCEDGVGQSSQEVVGHGVSEQPVQPALVSQQQQLCLGSFGAWWQAQPAVFLTLVVFKYNYAAINLYQKCGWTEVTRWTDKVWEEEAASGRNSGKPRRLLYVRPVPTTPTKVLEHLA